MSTSLTRSLPSLPGKSGRLFSRGAFLGGKNLCFYGPGQYPSTNYHKPTDWPASGSLLRMPQVCWLNAYMELARLGPTITQEWTADSFAPWFDGQAGVYSSFYGRVIYHQSGGTRPNGGIVTTRNVEYDEQERLMDLFNGAAEKINAIRKGRTWVYAWDWSSQDADNPVANPDISGFVQCPAPSTIFTSYAGTDFMNLWAGPAMLMTGFKNVFKPYETLPSPSDDSYMSGVNSSLIASNVRFKGRLLSIRHPDVAWYTPEFDPITYVNSRGGGVVFGYSDYRAVQSATYQNASDVFDYFEGFWRDYGVEHSGVTSDLTEDLVVNAIAGRYGFDPDTGVDLV